LIAFTIVIKYSFGIFMIMVTYTPIIGGF